MVVFNFLTEVEVRESKKIEICIEGKNFGNYHGVLLYKIKNKPVQVGIWMNVSLEGNERIKITGNFVKEGGKNGRILFVLPVVFLFIFFFLLILYKRKIS